MFKLFGPTHTVEEVVKELVEGLDAGTVVLREEELPKVDVRKFTAQLEHSIASTRKREIVLLVCSIISGLLVAATSIATVLIEPEIPVQQEVRVGRIVALLLAGFTGLVAGLVASLIKVRGVIVELRTYARVLKMADEITAERLASRVSAKLSRERELAH